MDNIPPPDHIMSIMDQVAQRYQKEELLNPTKTNSYHRITKTEAEAAPPPDHTAG